MSSWHSCSNSMHLIGVSCTVLAHSTFVLESKRADRQTDRWLARNNNCRNPIYCTVNKIDVEMHCLLQFTYWCRRLGFSWWGCRAWRWSLRIWFLVSWKCNTGTLLDSADCWPHLDGRQCIQRCSDRRSDTRLQLLCCRRTSLGLHQNRCLQTSTTYMLNKVITTMVIRPLDDLTWCVQSVVADLRPSACGTCGVVDGPIR